MLLILEQFVKPYEDLAGRSDYIGLATEAEFGPPQDLDIDSRVSNNQTAPTFLFGREGVRWGYRPSPMLNHWAAHRKFRIISPGVNYYHGPCLSRAAGSIADNRARRLFPQRQSQAQPRQARIFGRFFGSDAARYL